MAECLNCGSENPEGTAFCMECGHPMGEPDEAPGVDAQVPSETADTDKGLTASSDEADSESAVADAQEDDDAPEDEEASESEATDGSDSGVEHDSENSGADDDEEANDSEVTDESDAGLEHDSENAAADDDVDHGTLEGHALEASSDPDQEAEEESGNRGNEHPEDHEGSVGDDGDSGDESTDPAEATGGDVNRDGSGDTSADEIVDPAESLDKPSDEVVDESDGDGSDTGHSEDVGDHDAEDEGGTDESDSPSEEEDLGSDVGDALPSTEGAVADQVMKAAETDNAAHPGEVPDEVGEDSDSAQETTAETTLKPDENGEVEQADGEVASETVDLGPLAGLPEPPAGPPSPLSYEDGGQGELGVRWWLAPEPEEETSSEVTTEAASENRPSEGPKPSIPRPVVEVDHREGDGMPIDDRGGANHLPMIAAAVIIAAIIGYLVL